MRPPFELLGSATATSAPLRALTGDVLLGRCISSFELFEMTNLRVFSTETSVSALSTMVLYIAL